MRGFGVLGSLIAIEMHPLTIAKKTKKYNMFLRVKITFHGIARSQPKIKDRSF